MFEATKWLFATLALASLLLHLPALFAGANGAVRFAAGTSMVVLGLSWSAGYLRRSAPLAMDVVDAVAISVLALGSVAPTAAFGVVFGALWFRSLYGSGRRAILRCGIYAGALTAVIPLWPYVPGHAGTAFGPLMGVFPSMFLTVVVGRYLAGIVAARERATRLDAVHVSVGYQLLGVTDAAEIRRIAWAATDRICAAMPGLRVLKVVRGGDVLRVTGASGGFVDVPARLSGAALTLLEDGVVSHRETAHARAELDNLAATSCAWVGVRLPEVDDQLEGAWLLLGSPGVVATEAIVSLSSLANQVALALRNSETHQELTVQATLDNLTGLANRASFHTALSASIGDRFAGQTTVLFIDLDDFKDVNDIFGHRAGDDLLREAATRLRQATRPQDLCARLGGDEFAVLLPDTGSEAAEEVAQRIVDSVAAPVQVDGGTAYVGASVGVATATSETNVDQLIQHADVAMYAAKANGKGRIQVFEAGLLQADTSQASFEQELAAAAQNGELVVHYQPVLSLPDGRCTAAEALVRWEHPERGLLYPGDFIEVAERIGAIRSIGAHVLRRACADATTWRDTYPSAPLAIHVNISVLELDDEHFITSVMRCLSDFTLPANQLVLEVTETVAVSSPAAINQLKALAAQGIVIAIDDFGTGYSALTTLRSLPVQIVKIDRSFVAGSTVNPQDRAVTEAVVNMATKMGLRTIAEGVERIDQQRFLEQIGADGAQGFLYLRPTTAENFGAWLAAHLEGLSDIEKADSVVVPFMPRHAARRLGI